MSKTFEDTVVNGTDMGSGTVESTRLDRSWDRFVPGPSPTRQTLQVSPTLLTIFVTMSACAALMLSGWNLALFGSISSNSDYLDMLGLDTTIPRESLLCACVTAFYFIGVMCGALASGPISDAFGRRKATVCGLIVATIVVPLMASAQNFGWAMAFRILNGVATGCLDASALTWTAEMASRANRGHMVGACLCTAATGASLVYFMSYGLAHHATGSVTWRLPIAFQMVFVLAIAPTPFLLPESPRWLVKAGMIDRAREVLRALNAETLEDPNIIEEDLSQIIEAHQETLRHGPSRGFIGMLLPDGKGTARRTWSALFIQFGNQAFIGASFIAGYSVSVLVSGGWNSDTATALGGVAIICQAAGGVFGVTLSEKMGRRPALYGGAFLGTIVLALIGMCGYFVEKYGVSDPGKASHYSSVTLALLLIWCLQYGVTWLWCSFTYPAEIFPLQFRARGSSFSIRGFAAGAFLCNIVSSYLFSALGYATMFLLAGLSALVGIVCFLFMPETANLSLEEIDEVFKARLLQI